MRQVHRAVIFVAVLSMLFQASLAHECIHDKLQKQEPLTIDVPYRSGYNASIHRRGRMEAQQATFANMRIQVFFDSQSCVAPSTCGRCETVGQVVPTYSDGATVTCTQDDILTASKRDYIVNVLMTSARTWLQSALNVEPVNGNLVVAGDKCGSNPGIPVPTADRTTGVANADYVVYVTAVPLADRESATVAWAFACFRDQNGRPLVGHVNFVPARLTNAAARNDVDQREDIATAVHEIVHALGFSSPFFSRGYVDLNNVRQTGGTTTTTSAALGKQVTLIVTPRVVRESRNYFGCSTLTGLEIEDQGGSGTAGSHWEKRLMNQEFMNGVSSSVVSYYSRMTLAYFEDTGHYTANYNAASTGMTWGKGKGCDFVTKKCSDPDVRTKGEFCFDEAAGNGCTHDRTARGYCNVVEYSSPLEPQFQYMSKPTLGSAVQVDDFCPSYSPFKNRRCIDSTITASDIYGETYQSDSRCFTSNILRSGYSVASNPPVRCLRFSCSGTGFVRVHVGSVTINCPIDRTAGAADVSRLSGYNGGITCPPAEELGCFGPGGDDGGTPAPATPSPPTPAPPATPPPTPAPPGQTPAPPAWTPTPATPAPGITGTCADRLVCAQGLESNMPFCRKVADGLQSCLGTDCDTDLRRWLTLQGIDKHCGDRASMEAFGDENCVEGILGANELCFLYSGAIGVSSLWFATLFIVVIHLL